MSAALSRPAVVPRAGRSAALTDALRRCETTACAGLRVEGAAVPAIAAAILEEAANVGGGLIWRQRPHDVWLIGGAAAPCRRAYDLLRGMGWAATLLEFPGSHPALDAAMAEEPEPVPAVPPVAAGLEERAARLAPEAGHSLATLWRMGAAGPQLMAQRWMADPGALPAPPAVDWQGHAAALLGTRLLARAARGDWAMLRRQNLPLLLDLPWMAPPASLPAPPEGESHALVLPLPALTELAAWAALARQAGWGLAWSGMTPSLAHLLPSLPGGFVFATPGDAAGWPPDPRLVLSGLSGRAAVAQAVAAGFAICSRLGE